MKLLTVFIVLCGISIAYGAPESYERAAYYWPMNGAGNQSNAIITYDVVENVIADAYGVRFSPVSRLQTAASLSGKKSYIDVDAADIKDCLAFNFETCNDQPALSVAFWIRIRSANRILATGPYTVSPDGPGILIEYDDEKEIIEVKFTSLEKQWSVSIRLQKTVWCHVTATWTEDAGLTVALDGELDDPEYMVKDIFGVTKKISESTKSFDKMITIGKPLDKENEFGNFDISHLVVFFRELTSMEMLYIPSIPMKAGDDRAATCCLEKTIDPCYMDPCSSSNCSALEQKYSDCICPNMKHAECKPCPNFEKRVECLKDPCHGVICDKFPLAVCKSDNCGSCTKDFFIDGKKVECSMGSGCPNDEPIVNCVISPCQYAKCTKFPEAECKANYCGGCNKDFYVDDNKVDCTSDGYTQGSDGNFYKYYYNKLNWTDAKKACVSDGAQLVIDDSAAVHKHLLRQYRGHIFWIGLSELREAQWKFVNGIAVDMEHWASGEPNNYGGKDEGCAFAVANGNPFGWNAGWHDAPCDKKGPFLCQIKESLEFMSKPWTLHYAPQAPPLKKVIQGESFVVSCKTNDPNATVDLRVSSHYLHTTYVSGRSKFKGRIEENNQVFVVKNVAFRDAGYYKCVAKNRHQEIGMMKGKLAIHGKVTILPKIYPSIPVIMIELNKPYEVSCKAIGHPGKNENFLTWYRKTISGEKIKVKKPKNYKQMKLRAPFVEKLVFKRFTIADVGEYICAREVPRYPPTFASVKIVLKNYCFVDGNTYKAEEKFIPKDCSKRCVCLGFNMTICGPLCKPTKSCRPGETVFAHAKQVSKSPSCFCKEVICLTPNICNFEGKKYKKGEEFVSKSCTGWCKCNGNDAISCVSLCPPKPPHCVPGEMEISLPKRMSSSPLCFCTEKKCVKQSDICPMSPDGGRCYAYMRRWHYSPKDRACKLFIFGGCEGNPNNFESKRKCEQMCVNTTALMSPIVEREFCYFEERRYRVDQRFVSKYCDKSCICDKSNTISCVSLCPPHHIMCPEGQNVISQRKRVSRIPKCYCREKTCSKAVLNVTCSSCINRQVFRGAPGGNITFRYSMNCEFQSITIKNNRLFTVRAVGYNKAVTRGNSADKRFIFPRAVTEEGDNCVLEFPLTHLSLNDNGRSLTYRLQLEGGKDISGAIKLVVASSNQIKISGRIFFGDDIAQLPKMACASVKLINRNTANGGEDVKIDISGNKPNEGIPYSIIKELGPADKPGTSFELSVVINMGWCKDNFTSPWIKTGDYVTKEQHKVTLSDGTYSYDKDITVYLSNKS